MKRILLVTAIIFGVILPAIASHVIGGEMIYEYLGPGSAANTSKYKITLKIFRDQNCTGCAAMPASVDIGIFNNDNNTEYPGSNPFIVPKSSEIAVPINPYPNCVQNAPSISYNVGYYELIIDLPDNHEGYTAAFQTCCRVFPMQNVFNTGAVGGAGGTYSCVIPGDFTLTAGQHDNSPQFNSAISLICSEKPFSFDFSATDRDGDSLAYYFCDAKGSGSIGDAGSYNPAAPPYVSVPYINGYSPTKPLGVDATIDPHTGIISGIAPSAGRYVVCVCVDEYRNGVLIGTHSKDFIVNVTDCDFAGARLKPSYSSCDGFTYTFDNLTPSALNITFNWEFSYNNVIVGTSNTETTTFTFPDTGVYHIKLVVNRGDPCGDSATSTINVFPGFFPGFVSNGICINHPTQFTDTTHAAYGTVNGWTWNFGDASTSADTSHLQNPSYTYSTIGVKPVTFIVTSSKGCIDTVTNNVTIIDKPPINLAFRDTLICIPDAVQLQATGSGNFSWGPLINITNPGTGTPTVSPTTTTTYNVTLNDNGCINQDSVRVRVVDFVSLTAMPDTTICQGDTIHLRATTDGLQFLWSPAANLDDPTAPSPVATTVNTTTYQLIARIGSCTATDQLIVTAVPYPVANAGGDTTICYNSFAQLHGSVTGNQFSWSPGTGLNDSGILNPVATINTTTSYVLSSRDNKGCPKPGKDTIVVTVLPMIIPFAANDTAVVIGQPLQFNATGGVHYTWIPNTFLNNPTIANPVGIYDATIDSIRYKVLIANEAGCLDSASILVKVFKTNPYVFVPSGFTPNYDGKNDEIRPIAVGVKRIEYFRIYNRWGQLVFNTTVNGKGWDGKINGVPQGSATFVWMVKAIDYLDKPIFLKGTVILIR